MLAIDGSVRYSLGAPSLGHTTAVAASPDGTLFALATPSQLAICSVTGSVQQISRLPIDLRGYTGPVTLAWCPSARAAHSSPHAPQRAYRLCLSAPSVALVLEIGDDTTEKAAGWLEWLLGEEDEEEELSPDRLPDYPIRLIASITPANGATTFSACCGTLTHVLISRSDGVVAAFTWSGRAVYEAELKGVGSGGYAVQAMSCTPDGAALVVAFVSGIVISASLAYVPFLHIPQGSIRVVVHPGRPAFESSTPSTAARITSTCIARVDDGTFLLVLGYASRTVEVYQTLPVVLPAPVQAVAAAPAASATATAAATASAGIVPYGWRPVTRFQAHMEAAVRGIAIRTRTLPRDTVARIPYDDVKLHISPTVTVDRGAFVDVCSSTCNLAVLAGNNHVSLWTVHAPTRTLTLIHACGIDGLFFESSERDNACGTLLTVANGGFTCLIALSHACAAAPAPSLVALDTRVDEDEDEPEPQQPHVARLDVCDQLRDTSAAASAAWFMTADAVACMVTTTASSAVPAVTAALSLTPRGDHDAAPLTWVVARGSAHYAPTNAPFLHAAVSQDGNAVVCSGARGASIFYMKKRTWRVFSTPTQERSVIVHACAWVCDRACALLHGSRGGAWDIQLYPRTHLDTSLRLCSQPCALPTGAQPIAMTCSNSDVWIHPRADSSDSLICARAHMLAVTAVHVSQRSWDACVTSISKPTMKAAGDGASRVERADETVEEAPHAVIFVYRATFKSSTGLTKDVPPFVGDVTLLSEDAGRVGNIPLPPACAAACFAEEGQLRDPAFVYQTAAVKAEAMRQVHDLVRAPDTEALHTRVEAINIREATGVAMSLLALLRLPRAVADEGIASVLQLGKDVLQEAHGALELGVKALPVPVGAWLSLLPDFCITTRTGGVYVLHSATASMWRAVSHARAVAYAIQPRSYGSGSAATVCAIHTPDATHVYTRGCTTLGQPHMLCLGAITACASQAMDVQDHAGVHVHASTMLGHLTSQAGAAAFAHVGARMPAVPPALAEAERESDVATARSYRPKPRTTGGRSIVAAMPPSSNNALSRVSPSGIRLVPALQYLLQAALWEGITTGADTLDPLAAAAEMANAALRMHAPLVSPALRALLHDAIEAEARTRPASAADAAVVARLQRTGREASTGSLDALHVQPRNGGIVVADVHVKLSSSCSNAALSVLRPLADTLVAYMTKHRMPMQSVFGQSLVNDPRTPSPSGTATGSVSVYLHAVLALLRRVDMFLDVIAAVGRTIEEERLPALFPAAGVPRDLFRAALKRASALGGGVASTPVHNRASVHYLRVAAAFMLLVQEFGWRTRMPDHKGGASMDGASRRIALSIVSENMDDAQALLEAVGLSQDVSAALVGTRVRASLEGTSLASPRREADALLASPALAEALTAVSDSDPHTSSALMQIVDSAAMYCARLRAAGEEYAAFSAGTKSTPAAVSPRTPDTSASAITRATPPSGGWGLLGSVAYMLGIGAGADDSATARNGVDDGGHDGVGDADTDPTLRALRECTIELLVSIQSTVHRKPGGNFGIVLAPVNLAQAVKAESRGVPEELLSLAARAVPTHSELSLVTAALDKAREQQTAWLRTQLRDCVACVGGLTHASVTRGPALMVGDILVRMNSTTLTSVDFRAAVGALGAAPRDADIVCHRVISLPAIEVLRAILTAKDAE